MNYEEREKKAQTIIETAETKGSALFTGNFLIQYVVICHGKLFTVTQLEKGHCSGPVLGCGNHEMTIETIATAMNLR